LGREPSVALPLPVTFHPDVIIRREGVLLPGLEFPPPRDPDVTADRHPVVERLIDHGGRIYDAGGEERVQDQDRACTGQEAPEEVVVPMRVVVVIPVMPPPRLDRHGRPA